MSYLLIFLNKSSNDKNKHLKLILITSLFTSSFIGVLYLLSINLNDNNIISIAIILSSIFIYIITRDIELETRMDYFLSLFACISISLGYMIHSFIILLFYYYIKNHFDLLIIKEDKTSSNAEIIDTDE